MNEHIGDAGMKSRTVAERRRSAMDRIGRDVHEMQHEIDELTRKIKEMRRLLDPTSEQIDSICLSVTHDYGLMNADDRFWLRSTVIDVIRALQTELERLK